MKRFQRLRGTLQVATALLVIAAALIGWRWSNGNVGTVQPGAIYRSAQLSADSLEHLIELKKIKTVLNLRGPNPEENWYQKERAAVLQSGATLVDLPLASDYWLTFEQAETILQILDESERPLLIHCQFGSERTGLVSAIAELIRPGGSPENAAAQFTPYYLFLPVQDGLVMRGHLDQYTYWLDESGARHSPSRFRDWIRDHYRPGTPNRSQWPYDPYPLRVVTKPTVERLIR